MAGLRIAHVFPAGAGVAGLHGSAREMVDGEIALGHDAKVVHPAPGFRADFTKDPTLGDQDWLRNEAHVVVCNGALGQALQGIDLPIVDVMHGAPFYCFQLEKANRSAGWSALRARRRDSRYRAFVTMWEEHLPVWRLLLPGRKVYCVPPPVDTEKWRPAQSYTELAPHQKPYDFGGRAGKTNIVCGSLWREDKTPFHVIVAAALWAATQPSARVHLYGTSGNSATETLTGALADLGVLGEAKPLVNDLVAVYQAADCAITHRRVASRGVREAMSCGCPVVAGGPNAGSDFWADGEDVPGFGDVLSRAVHADKERVRAQAITQWGLARTAQAMTTIYREAIDSFPIST